MPFSLASSFDAILSVTQCVGFCKSCFCAPQFTPYIEYKGAEEHC